MKIENKFNNKKEIIITILIVVLAIFGLVVRVNQLEEENKSTYDSDWRYHQYHPRTYNTNSNTDNSYANQVGSNKSSSDSTINDDPYGKQFYDDADDFADDNAAEFGDGDEDDGWDDAFGYYEEN